MIKNQLTKENVFLVLTDIKTGLSRVQKAKNIVTDAGDIYYAQKATGEVPINPFAVMELGTAGLVPAKGLDRSAITSFVTNSQKVFDTGFPKSNDASVSNTGKAVNAVTFSTTYISTEANSAGIDRVIITNATPGASEPILMYATFVAITKASTDILQVFVNHAMTGV